jgi:hypothetical protein
MLENSRSALRDSHVGEEKKEWLIGRMANINKDPRRKKMRHENTSRTIIEEIMAR